MPLFSLAAALLVLLLVGCFGPGLWIVGHLRLSPLEKLCGAMASSLIVVYLASFTLFVAHAPLIGYWALAAIFAVAMLAGRKTAALLLRHRASRSAILGFAAVLGWDFVQLSLSPNYGGGGWGGDWWEHFERVRYFLHLLPDTHLFLNQYFLPARPPMMNLIAAFFCRMIGYSPDGPSYEIYSLVFMFLNSLAFLPCCLLLGRLGRRGSRTVAILTILFILNPSIVQNATYAWTKSLCAGLVILGICFYLRSGPKNAIRNLASLLCFASAILVHYSAVPYVLAVAAHWLFFRVARDPRNLAPMLAPIAAAGMLLASWFAWSWSEFGFAVTFFSNTTAASIGGDPGSTPIRIAYNLFTTLVPYPLHPIPADARIAIDSWYAVRDRFFRAAQTTLSIMIGSTGWLVAAIAAGRCLRDRRAADAERRPFWIMLFLIGYVLGVMSLPYREAFGGAQVTLQPLVLVAVSFIAAQLPTLGRGVFALCLLGLAVDYSLGIFLHFHLRTHLAIALRTMSDYSPDMFATPQGKDLWAYWETMHHGVIYWGKHMEPVWLVLETISVTVAAASLVQLGRLRAALVRSR